MNRFVLLAVFLFFAGCGGTEDSGSGTNTLLVTASIEFENQIPNASQSADFNVRYEVEVRRNNQPVVDAQVRLTPDGQDAITLGGNDVPQGKYTGSNVGWSSRYRLDVESGSDYVRGARLESPDIHVFTAPTLGQVVPAGADYQIRWDRDRQGDFAIIKTKQLGDTDIQDSGSFILSGVYLDGDQDKQKEDEVSLIRKKQTGLTGGLSGSKLEITLRNRVSFLIDIQP